MTSRDQIIYQEAADLWRELHGEPVPEGVDGAAMLVLLLRDLPAPGYDRLANPHLRPANIAFPGRD